MITYKPNRPGVAVILKTEFRDAIQANAEAIADRVRAAEPDADVAVKTYTTDRSAASVTIRDPRARLWQVRDGIFTRAAAGMQIRLR